MKSLTPPTRDQWLQRLQKELKGKAPDELSRHITDDWHVKPMYTEGASTALFSKQTNEWDIIEHIKVTDVSEARAQSLSALEGGATALLWEVPSGFTDFHSLGKGVEHAWIRTYVQLETAESVRAFLHYADHDWRGGLLLSPQTWLSQLDLLKDCAHSLPTFRNLCYEGNAHVDAAQLPQCLAAVASKAVSAIETLAKHGWTSTEAIAQLSFNWNIGHDFLFTVATLRAWKLLWYNVQCAYEIDAVPMPPMGVRIANSALSTDAYDNMISLPIMALAAVCGGTDALWLPPADTETSQSIVGTTKWSRDVQHILQMESRLHQVVDPAAGSYYWDNLTQQIAEQAWVAFCQST